MYTRTFSYSKSFQFGEDQGPYELELKNVEITSENQDVQSAFPGETSVPMEAVSIETDDGPTDFAYYWPIENEGNTYFLFVEIGDSSPLRAVILGEQGGMVASDNMGPPTSDIPPLPVCFMPGTLIATPSGPRAVESLQAGDLVCTADGRVVPVVWMGRQTLHKLFSPAERFCPIRIRAGALASGVPERDLLVTSDHALMLDGLAVNAAALGNGRTILREPKDALPEKLTYWHIETAAHDVVLAEGAPAETFVDNVTRRRFDNYADYEARFGAERRRIEENPAPRVMSRRQLPESIRARLAARAEELEQAETAA